MLDGINSAISSSGVTITTTQYAGSTAIDVRHANCVSFDFDFTKGSLTNIVAAVQVSNDGTNWFTVQQPASSFTATATSQFNISLYPVKHKYARAAAIATGTITSAVLTVSGYAGVV